MAVENNQTNLIIEVDRALLNPLIMSSPDKSRRIPIIHSALTYFPTQHINI